MSWYLPLVLENILWLLCTVLYILYCTWCHCVKGWKALKTMWESENQLFYCKLNSLVSSCSSANFPHLYNLLLVQKSNGHYVVLGEENQTHKKLFFFFPPYLNNYGKKVPRTLFEARKLAGSTKYKQSQTVWNCVVIKGQFVHSVMKMKRVCLSVKWNKRNKIKKTVNPPLCVTVSLPIRLLL